MFPLSGIKIPFSIFNRVVFPDPFGPIMRRISLFGKTPKALCIISTAPYNIERFKLFVNFFPAFSTFIANSGIYILSGIFVSTKWNILQQIKKTNIDNIDEIVKSTGSLIYPYTIKSLGAFIKAASGFNLKNKYSLVDIG